VHDIPCMMLQRLAVNFAMVCTNHKLKFHKSWNPRNNNKERVGKVAKVGNHDGSKCKKKYGCYAILFLS